MDAIEPQRSTPERFVLLAAIDDSEASSEVARTAADYAWMRPGAEVHLLHVVEPTSSSTPSAVGPMAMNEVLTAPTGLLRRTRDAILSTCDAKIVAHIAPGEPWREIVQLAVDLEADLVVLGTHGRSGFRRFVVGSVAEVVVRKAPCPVLVARKKAPHATDVPEIEPACPKCLAVQRETSGATLWCAQHSEHRPRAHVHYESPPGFGAGSMLVR